MAMARVAAFFGSVFNVSLSFLSFVYPAWKTYKAIEYHNVKDSQAMLIYWLVHAWLASVKIFMDEFFSKATPHYELYKSLLLLLIASPLVGPHLIYNVVIRPFFEKHSEDIQKVVTLSKKQLSELEEAANAVELVAKDAIGVVEKKAVRFGRKTKLRVRELRDAIRDGTEEIGETGLEVFRVIRRRVKRTAVKLGLRKDSLIPAQLAAGARSAGQVELERLAEETENGGDDGSDSESEYEIEAVPLTPHLRASLIGRTEEPGAAESEAAVPPPSEAPSAPVLEAPSAPLEAPSAPAAESSSSDAVRSSPDPEDFEVVAADPNEATS